MLLFCEIAKTIITELIYIKLIDSKCKNELENIINLKKILITYNTKKYSGIIAKLNIVFIIFNEKNKKKILFDLTKKNNKNSPLGGNIEPSI